MSGYFAEVRRAGFDIGLSTGKLTKAMVDVLVQLPRRVSSRPAGRLAGHSRRVAG